MSKRQELEALMNDGARWWQSGGSRRLLDLIREVLAEADWEIAALKESLAIDAQQFDDGEATVSALRASLAKAQAENERLRRVIHGEEPPQCGCQGGQYACDGDCDWAAGGEHE